MAHVLPSSSVPRRLATAHRGIGLAVLLASLGCDRTHQPTAPIATSTPKGSTARRTVEHEPREPASALEMRHSGEEDPSDAHEDPSGAHEDGPPAGTLAAADTTTPAGTLTIGLTHDAEGKPFGDPTLLTPQPPPDHPHGEPRRFQPIEDPKGTLLPFYRMLVRTDAKEAGAITRVTHLGDSSIGHDGLSHAIRSRMQDRFGDGGAGFVLIDRTADTNYGSKVATITAPRPWEACFVTNLCKRDGHYGLGGHTFWTSDKATSRVATLDEGSYGTTASHIELWYMAQPRGGRFKVKVDRDTTTVIPTRAEAVEDRWHVIDVEPGPHTITVSAAGGGEARAYGVVLETDGPGVVWDSASMIGAYTKRLNGFDRDHIAGQIAHRAPDLLVLNFGGNDLRRMVSHKVDPETYEKEYGAGLDRLLAQRPGQPCLLVGVIDHGRSGTYDVPPKVVDTMITTQRTIAFAYGCAFFDTVAAMGGSGSLRKWRKRSPKLAEPDLKHLNHRGRDLIGDLMYQALVAGYESFRHHEGG